ncbi:MAG: Fur family transcriptional regulator [Trueperaceae bacterium]
MPIRSEQTFHAAVDTLRSHGLRLTPQRLDLLRLLVEAPGSLSAYDIYPLLRRKHPNVSMDTVYRNLFMLTTSGLVGQINLQNREAARFEFQGKGHHHHAVCLSCGTALCIDGCPSELDALFCDTPGFRTVNHVFELYGYCSDCEQP